MADATHRNYVITVSVDGSGNMTVALKTLAGTDPSPSDPILVKIGDSWRAITSALSVTAAAATNWCNSGGAALATQAVGYFVYLGYNATDGVVIGFSRIPYAAAYSDFSATSTNEKFCKINDISNATATDKYENIGYFHATLSAGAGYTWSSPTSIINRPVYESKWLSWTPTFSGFSSNPTGNDFKYKIGKDNLVTVNCTTGVDGVSNATSFTVTLPFISSALSHVPLGARRDNDLFFGGGGTAKLTASSNVCTFYQPASLTDNWTAANRKAIWCQFYYMI